MNNILNPKGAEKLGSFLGAILIIGTTIVVILFFIGVIINLIRWIV